MSIRAWLAIGLGQRLGGVEARRSRPDHREMPHSCSRLVLRVMLAAWGGEAQAQPSCVVFEQEVALFLEHRLDRPANIAEHARQHAHPHADFGFLDVDLGVNGWPMRVDVRG